VNMASLSVEPFVEPGSCLAGDICIRNPWPGIFQTIWGQSERLVDSYYKKYCRDPPKVTSGFAAASPAHHTDGVSSLDRVKRVAGFSA
jgi:hypothetical protein